ncbi:hypothetical protein GCM10009682_23650 [Luedemannella flava]|uniref:HTH marR-type domain-containing protein n=2 Tax=Luedemannella flava TaxID=349316 RepID=A0ABN2LWA7_9ACTN
MNAADRTTAALVDDLLATSRLLVGLSARSLAGIDADVTLAQYRVLIILAGKGAQRTSDLATELTLGLSTMTRMCDRLRRKDLVRRYRRGDDRRATWIALTEHGRAVVGEVMRSRRASIAAVASAIPEEDRMAVSGALRALLSSAGELTEAEWSRQWQRSNKPDPLEVEA